MWKFDSKLRKSQENNHSSSRLKAMKGGSGGEWVREWVEYTRRSWWWIRTQTFKKAVVGIKFSPSSSVTAQVLYFLSNTSSWSPLLKDESIAIATPIEKVTFKCFKIMLFNHQRVSQYLYSLGLIENQLNFHFHFAARHLGSFHSDFHNFHSVSWTLSS